MKVNLDRIPFLVINSFSFVKRFITDSLLYKYSTFIPLFFVLNTKVSKSGLIIVSFFTLISFISGNFDSFYYLIPFFLLILFKTSFYKLDFEKLILYTRWFLLISVFYSIVQIIFGFLPHEIIWINSDLSIVNSDNMFIGDRSIRPFSFFASIPEYALFCCIYLYYFLNKRNFLWIFISGSGLLLSGSRGLIFSFLISIVVINLFKIRAFKKLIFSSLLIAVFSIAILIQFSDYFLSLQMAYSDSRLLLFQTFTTRYFQFIEFFDSFDLSNILIPESNIYSESSDVTYDNLYITILSNFGFFGFVLFYFLFSKVHSKTSLFFLCIFLVYGLFHDLIYSFYLMFLFFISIFSSKND